MRITDNHRFPHGPYVPAAETDIRKTFARASRQYLACVFDNPPPTDSAPQPDQKQDTPCTSAK